MGAKTEIGGVESMSHCHLCPHTFDHMVYIQCLFILLLKKDANFLAFFTFTEKIICFEVVCTESRHLFLLIFHDASLSISRRCTGREL